MRRVATTHTAICKTLLERGCLSCCCCVVVPFVIIVCCCCCLCCALHMKRVCDTQKIAVAFALAWQQAAASGDGDSDSDVSPRSDRALTALTIVCSLFHSLSLSLSHFACRSAHAELFDAFLIALLPRWALFDLIKSMRHLIKTHADRQDNTETV